VLRIRPGVPEDRPALIAMADEAVAWLVSIGRGEQWGTTPWSQNQHSVDRLNEMVAGDGLRVAELDHRPVGVMALGEPPPYVPKTTEPEHLAPTPRPGHRPGATTACRRRSAAPASQDPPTRLLGRR
jgi:hypothetical protein